MAQKDPGNDGPSLELPTFGFGRKKKESAPEASPAVGPVEAPEPTPVEPAQATSIDGQAAATVTGLVVGALLVGLVWGSPRLCEVARGTSSCGRPGFVVLLAILAVLVVVGRALLQRLGASDPGSTSFLGVGVVTVVVLLLLTGQLYEWWTLLVVPAVAVASFSLAQWVSTAFVETPEGNLHR